jgi:hypothetical protein
MVGVITGWDVLAHPVATIRCFGWRVFFRAVVPWQDESFLSLVQSAVFLNHTASDASAILERCITLELRAKRVYRALGRALSDQGLVAPFFNALADQEQYHADLLAVCRAAVIRRGWNEGAFSPWLAYLPRLEEQMEAAEAAVYQIDSVDAALQLVIQIESSEVNPVFHAALAASNAAFVKRLRPFHDAMDAHMSYIAERLPQLSPGLGPACKELRAKYPSARV